MSQVLRAPIFIVGCPRSGTTLLRLILDAHPSISAGEETHFLRDMERIVGEHWRLVGQYGFERQYWIDRIRAFYGGFMDDYARRRGRHRWAEKTPFYAMHLPFIDELFPDALYVHIIRDGRDVVQSHRDRWGYRSALATARRKWAHYITTIRGFAAGLPPERYLELRYEDLVSDPEQSLRRLLTFLDEPWDPAVLEYDRAEHDGTERYARFTAGRRAEGGEQGAIYRSRIGAGRRRLDPVLGALLRRRAGRLMKDLGYAD